MDFGSTAENEHVSTLTEHMQHLASANIHVKFCSPLPGSWKQHSANEILTAGGKQQLKILLTICASSEKLDVLCSSLPPAPWWEHSIGERRAPLAGTSCRSCCVSLGAAAGQE